MRKTCLLRKVVLLQMQYRKTMKVNFPFLVLYLMIWVSYSPGATVEAKVNKESYPGIGDPTLSAS